MNRTRRDLLLLALVSCAVRLGIAALIPRPGYMDAAYYATGALRIAQGGGFSEAFIWNYLNDPPGIPHPGFLYWMPLPSLLAAPSAALCPGSFFAMQIPLAGLAALPPLVAYELAWQVTQRRRLAWAAGLLMLFSGFFFPYWTLPETFAPFSLFGSLALYRAGGWWTDRENQGRRFSYWLVAGLLAGLAHLSRADGILLLPVVALGPLLRSQRARAQATDHRGHFVSRSTVYSLSAVLLGYLLILGPWYLRNILTIGSPLAPAGSKTLWLTEYDDIFCYNCDLSIRSYLAWGWKNILTSKLSALWINAQRFLAEDCLIFLFPLVCVGLFRLRRLPHFLLASIYLLVVFLLHSLAFTFPGWRGGFFHSSSALLPFLYAAAMEGLDAVLGWAARKRGWRRSQAQAVFTTAIVLAAVVLSIHIGWEKIESWQTADVVYEEIDQWLIEQDAPDGRVMVGNPPAFWYHTGRPTVVVPNAEVETMLAICDRYAIDYLVLETDHPSSLDALYTGETTVERLRLEKKFKRDSVLVWKIE